MNEMTDTQFGIRIFLLFYSILAPMVLISKYDEGWSLAQKSISFILAGPFACAFALGYHPSKRAYSIFISAWKAIGSVKTDESKDKPIDDLSNTPDLKQEEKKDIKKEDKNDEVNEESAQEETIMPEVKKACELLRAGDYHESEDDHGVLWYKFALGTDLDVKIRSYAQTVSGQCFGDKWNVPTRWRRIFIGKNSYLMNSRETSEFDAAINAKEAEKEEAISKKFLAYAPSSPKKPTPKKRKK